MEVCSPKGPVVGSLFVSGVMVKDDSGLRAIGVKDSKLLTPKKREELFDKISECKHLIVEAGVDEIDDAVNGKEGLNLNKLEAKMTGKIINELKPDVAIIDCPSNNVAQYRMILEGFLTHKCKLVIEHKADANHPVAAAASILAKVSRDRHVRGISQMMGVDIGSGYPSDPRAVKFLNENWEKHPELFRKSWSSYQDVAKKKGQKGLNEFS